MSAYLVDHPNPNRQMRGRERKNPLGKIGLTGVMVVHTAESPADTRGPDTGTDNVARFIGTRKGENNKGSYHSLADSDSRLRVVPFTHVAYGAGTPTGVNDYALHFSVAASAAQWATLPQDWKDGAIHDLALEMFDGIKHIYKTEGIKVPLKRIKKSDVEKGRPGLISHGELDPGRRSDPGKDFPWGQLIKELTAMVKDWNWGVKKPGRKTPPTAPVLAKPVPKAPVTQPKKKTLDFKLVLANIKNAGGGVDDLPRAEVKADARRAAKMGNVGLLQEIYEPNDWVDVRDGVRPFSVSDRNDPVKQMCTVFWDGSIFDLREQTVIPLPGNSPGAKGGTPRAMKEVILVAKNTALPKFVFLDVHPVNGAFGSNRQLNTPQRRGWHAQQVRLINNRALSRRREGCIVVVGGDWNKELADIPLPAGAQWVIGSKSSRTIDGAYVLLPKGVSCKAGTTVTQDGHTDHQLRAALLQFKMA